MTGRVATIVGTLAAAAIGWLAWSRAPMLLAGTPLAEAGVLAQVIAAVLALTAFDRLWQLISRRVLGDVDHVRG